MAVPRPTTPSVPADPILCNEFRVGASYSTWRPRGSGDWLLIVTCGGAGVVKSGGQALVLNPGDAVLFAPGAAQDYSTERKASRWHLRWAHFQPRPHWRPSLLWPEFTPRISHVRLPAPSQHAVSDALARMVTVHRLGGALATDLAMNALEEALLWIFRATTNSQTATMDTRVQRAAHYLATHPQEPFRLDRLADFCGLSASRLSYLFRRELHETPQRFSEKLRLEIARQLLSASNLSVGEIANEVGFADALYFSRRYRRAFGRAPSEERAP
jgi:AraC family transcriptional regulator, arabinose operon regulatory protein